MLVKTNAVTALEVESLDSMSISSCTRSHRRSSLHSELYCFSCSLLHGIMLRQ